MALGPRLEIRQAQSLTLTPQLMQSIRLLQLNHLEINAFVDAELERNPLLERDDTSGGDEGPDPEPVTQYSADPVDSVAHGEQIGSAKDIADNLDTDAANVFPEQVGQDSLAQSMANHSESRNGATSEAGPDIDSYCSAPVTMAEHLNEQIAYLLRTPSDRLIAQHLVDNLNEAGYLTVDCESIAETLGAEVEDVEAVLFCLQGCEPAGIFARSVSECLAIQLREKDRLDPLMQKLLDNLDLIGAHNIPALCKTIGVDREDIAEMLGELRELDPKPGRAFDGVSVQAVVPDVFVRPASDGTWEIELNADILPRVLVNRTYYAQVVRKARSSAEKTFLTDCLQTANWLTKSLDQRAQTILKVATEIVSQQDAFLLHGISHLRPMTLKMVAEEIDMHESTVSRVTVNKYISTPRGLFEMKYFFTTALSSMSSGSADHSAEAVRHRIRQFIEAEDYKSILSDDTIAEMLQSEMGVDVARRTVAKYREAMNIPSSVIRRRQKKTIMQLA